MRFFFLAALLACLTSEAATAEKTHLLCRYTSEYDSSRDTWEDIDWSEIISLRYKGNELEDFSLPFDCERGEITKSITKHKILGSCDEQDGVFDIMIFKSFEMNRFSGEFVHHFDIISDEFDFMRWRGICTEAERRF